MNSANEYFYLFSRKRDIMQNINDNNLTGSIEVERARMTYQN